MFLPILACPYKHKQSTLCVLVLRASADHQATEAVLQQAQEQPSTALQ